MEEDIVEAVAVGELEPGAPTVVERVAAEDEGAAGECRGLLVDAKGELAARCEAGAIAAGGEPGKAHLFEEPVGAVEGAPGVGAGDVDLAGRSGDGEGICRPRGRREADDPGGAGRRDAREVAAKFPFRVAGDGARQGGFDREPGKCVGGEGHAGDATRAVRGKPERAPGALRRLRLPRT